MVQYLQSQKQQSQSKTSYRVKSSDEDGLGMSFSSSMVFEVTHPLEAVIKLREYLNKHEKYPYTLSAFQDDCFNDILYAYDEIDSLDIDSIFKNRNIDEIIARFVEGQLNNDTLWLEKCKSKPVKKPLMSFNQTGQEVSKLRACLKRYLKSKRTLPKVSRYYRIKYHGGEEYFGIKCSSLLIKASSPLKAIFKLRDYLNEHAKYPKPFDAFDDDYFNDIVADYKGIKDPEDIESVFKSKYIDKIMDELVQTEFNNSSMWLEEYQAPELL